MLGEIKMETKPSLIEALRDLLERSSDNWDAAAVRGGLGAILDHHLKNAEPAQSDDAPPLSPGAPLLETWTPYRAKVTRVQAIRHPEKDAFIVAAENGEVTIVSREKFNTVFEADR